MTDQPAAVVETPAPSEIPSEADQLAELSRIYDENQPEEEAAAPKEPAAEPEAEPEPEAKAEEPKEEAEPEPVAVEAPSHLPEEVQALWKDIPESARGVLEKSYRGLGDRLAQQGRIVSAVKPSFDVLVKAAQELPGLHDMTPAQIAQDVFNLAKISAQFAADPVGSILNLAVEKGALDGLRAALSGQQPDPGAGALHQKIASLEAQIARMGDKGTISEIVQQQMEQAGAVQEVQRFAAEAEHWGAVEDAIPAFVPLAVKRLGESASAKDKLALAYDMAVNADPDLRAKVRSASKKEPEPDPQKAAEAARAASINVSSRGAATPKPLTERQRLELAYDEAQRK